MSELQLQRIVLFHGPNRNLRFETYRTFVSSKLALGACSPQPLYQPIIDLLSMIF